MYHIRLQFAFYRTQNYKPRDGSTQIVVTDLANNLYIDVSASSSLSVNTLNKVVENIAVLSRQDTP